MIPINVRFDDGRTFKYVPLEDMTPQEGVQICLVLIGGLALGHWDLEEVWAHLDEAQRHFQLEPK